MLWQATCDVYRRICEDLRPTPSKSHYVYNLRDVSKVFQGLHPPSFSHRFSCRAIPQQQRAENIASLALILFCRPFPSRLCPARRYLTGILQIQPFAMSNEQAMIRLWAHECMRVFHDRLVDGADQRVFTELLVEMVKRSAGQWRGAPRASLP